MRSIRLTGPVALFMLTVAGCGQTGAGPALEPGPAAATRPTDLEAPYPPAVVVAIERLADELGVPPRAVEVVDYGGAEWPDGCLGLPGPNESCSAAIVPGWRIVLRLGGELHFYRADALGDNFREEADGTGHQPGS